jgi:hypothetical protein
MPILKGFPPSNTISPSVRITEKDYSFLDTTPSVHAAGLVGFATKGPINVPTLITSLRELHTTFGFPHPDTADPYMIYAAEAYLQFSNQLYVVRCAENRASNSDAATTAKVDIPAAGGAVNIIGNVPGPFVFANDAFFRWRLNGVLASKVLVVLKNTISEPQYTTTEVVDMLNEQLSELDGITFYVTDDDTVALKTTFSYGTAASVELVSVQNSLYGPGSVVGLGTTMTAASVTSQLAKYPNNSYQSTGNWNFSGFVNLYLHIVVDGTDNVNIDNVVQQVSIPTTNTTTAAIAAYINNQITAATIPGGFVASNVGGNLKLTTLHSGRDASIVVKSSSTAIGLFNFDSKTHFGTSPSAVSNQLVDVTYAAGIVTGSASVAGEVTFTVTADSPGTEGNLTQVVIDSNIRDGTFVIQVYNDGIQVESWGQLVKDQASRFYVETLMALISDYIRVVDNTATLASPLPGTYTLAGGTNGIPTDPDAQDDLLIGNELTFTGMQALSEPEQVDIDLLAIPGHSSTNVIIAGLELCQNKRSDCFFVIDPPFGLSVNEIVDWCNGRHPLNLTKLDNDFGALYWPWVKIRDTHNRIDVWVPPSGSVLATYVNSDNISFPWFAPAGEVRGIVFNILDTYTKPTLEERDLMYGNRNCINPIIHFSDLANFTIWGQKTLQRRPSALDRVNVRRMLLYVEKLIRRRSRRLLFDPHDEFLRAQFTNVASDVLDAVKRDRGIHDYFVKCDDELNPPDVIDRNEMRAKIGIQPTRAAEFIFIEFSVHRTGTFSENADTF